MLTVRKKFLFSIVFYSALSLFNIANAKIEIVLGQLSLEQNPNLFLAVPITLEPEIVLSRDQFVLSYNKLKRAPNWVAWKLDPENMGISGRTDNFRLDAELEDYLAKSSSTHHAVEQTEYRGSCFDRGHQTPSADRTDTTDNNSATFVMSNMIPQTPYLNRVIWAHLEQYTRDLVKKQGKKAFVIAGPIYDQDFGAIGPNKDIRVPSKQFKIIYFLNANESPENINVETEVISVLMPNTHQNGSQPMENRATLCKPFVLTPNDKNDWMKYLSTVSEIEKLSGITFRSKRMLPSEGGPLEAAAIKN